MTEFMASLAHAGLNTENVMVCFKENHLGELLLRQWTAHPQLKRTQENAAHRRHPDVRSEVAPAT
jgi:hypothetical protein